MKVDEIQQDRDPDRLILAETPKTALVYSIKPMEGTGTEYTNSYTIIRLKSETIFLLTDDV